MTTPQHTKKPDTGADSGQEQRLVRPTLILDQTSKFTAVKLKRGENIKWTRDGEGNVVGYKITRVDDFISDDFKKQLKGLTLSRTCSNAIRYFNSTNAKDMGGED